MDRLALLFALSLSAGCFTEPDVVPGETEDDDGTTTAASAGEAGAVGSTSASEDPDMTSGGSENDESTTGSSTSSTNGAADEAGDDGSTSTGFEGVVLDLYERACEAIWLDGNALPVDCPSMAPPGTPSTIIPQPGFVLPPPLGETAPALLFQPNTGDGLKLLQGEWTIPPGFERFGSPLFVTTAICTTPPPGNVCTMELQVRLLRNGENVSTAILSIEAGPPTEIISPLQTEAQPGDTLLIGAINEDEDGDAEGLALVEPILLFE